MKSKTNTKKGTIRHWLHPGEPHYYDAIEAMGFAMLKGYSVINIKQVFNMENARFLYDVLREADMINKLPQKMYKGLDSIPAPMRSALEKMDFRFPRWCNGRNPPLDPVTAAKMLADPMIRGNEDSEAAHKAFARDFPYVYRQVFGVVLEDEISPYNEHLGPTPRHTFIVRPKNNVYVAETEELGPKVFGNGLTAAIALRKLQHELGIIAGIRKLRLMKDRNP